MRSLLPVLLLLLVTACVPASPKTAAETAATGQSGLTGKAFLKKDGQPLEGVYINVYQKNVPNLLGPSQYISAATDSAGHYRLDVPPGSYFVVARKRLSGMATGPLSPGDYFSEDPRMVVVIQPGQHTRVDLPMINMSAPMFFKRDLAAVTTETGVKGILVDAAGKPVPGGFAAAYTTRDVKRVPDYVSTLTGTDGTFTLYLPQGGDYYLGARIHAWDMPRPGELYGTYGQAEPEPMRVPNKSFVEGIRIIMTPFSGTYKEGKSKKPF